MFSRGIRGRIVNLVAWVTAGPSSGRMAVRDGFDGAHRRQMESRFIATFSTLRPGRA
jgi:hypothetical protein